MQCTAYHARKPLEGENDRGSANRNEQVGLNCQVIKYLAVLIF